MLKNLSRTIENFRLVNYEPSEELFIENNISTKRALMKRYMMVEKTKDADRIGILVGTLGASRYGAIIDQVRKIVKSAGKKVYIFLVGKPNVPKLANFPGECMFNDFLACVEHFLPHSLISSPLRYVNFVIFHTSLFIILITFYYATLFLRACSLKSPQPKSPIPIDYTHIALSRH